MPFPLKLENINLVRSHLTKISDELSLNYRNLHYEFVLTSRLFLLGNIQKSSGIIWDNKPQISQRCHSPKKQQIEQKNVLLTKLVFDYRLCFLLYLSNKLKEM